MITFTSIEYKNFQSVGNHPIKIDLTSSPTTCIGGKNGNGKSLILNAITYGLFGKTLSGIKLSQAINSVNKKKLLVTVNFTKHGDDWKVVRGEKPKKFEIYKNDEMIDKYANSRDQQDFLEIVLGMDYKLFTQIVVLNKERYVPFMEMTTQDRRKVIEDILDISVFSYMNDIVKRELKELQREEANLDKEREVIKTQIEGQSRLIRELQEQKDSAKQKRQEAIDQKQEELEKLTKQKETLQEELSKIDVQAHDAVQKRIREFEQLGQEFQTKIKSQEKNKSFFEDNDVCPTCKQDIDQDLKNKKINEAQSSIDETLDVVHQCTSELEELVAQDKEFKELKKRQQELQSEEKSLNFYIGQLEKEIRQLTSQDSSENDSIDSKLRGHVNTYEEYEQRLDAVSNDLRSLYDKKDKYEELRNSLKDDGIKANIIKEYIAFINKKINDYLHAMDFYINMTMDENFKETFSAMHKDGFSYANLSTGQKTRVSIAVWLALLEVASIKNSVVTNLVMIDEILEPLDAEGVQDVMSLFHSKLKNKNIFVITQRFEEFQEQFDSSLHMQLNHQGFTEISYG